MRTCQRRSLLLLAASLLVLLLAALGRTLGWNLAPRLDGMLWGFGVGGLFASAVLWWSPDTADVAPAHLVRRYYRDFVPPMVGYVVVMLFWKRLLDAIEPVALRWVVALLPALLILWVMRAVVRYVRDSDELQRRIELESIAIATMLVSAVTLAAGFLQSAKLIDLPSKSALLLVFPLLCMFYAVVKVVLARRYG